MFQLFQLLQYLRARDAEGLGKRRPDASRLHAPSHLRSCENRVLSSNNSANTGVSTARPTAPCSTPARYTLSWFISAWGVSCNSSKPSCKKWTCPPDNHARTFDMSGEILTCLGHTDWHYFEPCTHPTPGGFRGLNCLARLALARERTPSLLINLKEFFFEPAVGSGPNLARMCP